MHEQEKNADFLAYHAFIFLSEKWLFLFSFKSHGSHEELF